MARDLKPNFVSNGVICAFRIDTEGRASAVSVEDAARREPGSFGWIHLNLADHQAQVWLQRREDLGELVVETMTDRKSPPDLHAIDGGFLLTLEDRKVELGEAIRELGEMRVWLEQDRVITARWTPLWATNQMRTTLAGGTGPGSTLEFLSELVDVVVGDFEPLVDALLEDLDRLEDLLVGGKIENLAGRLGVVRREAIDLRRHLQPKRRVLARLHANFPAWGSAEDRVRFGSAVDGMERLAGAIAEVEERARQLQDEQNALMNERSSRNLYFLTVLSALLLPLNVVTGIWGMNMGGLPWTDTDPPSDNGFLYVLGIMLMVFVGTLGIMKAKKWL